MPPTKQRKDAALPQENMIINGIKIHTMTAEYGIIPNGYVKVENGKIAAVGEGERTDDDTVLYESGWLFPGFIDGHTHIGIAEDSLGFEGDDINETGDPTTPQLRAMDGINPFDRAFREALEAGVTTAAVAPGSANPIGGRICVLKTDGRVVDQMLVREPAAMKFALGENPKTVYHGKNQSPETRMSTASMIREALIKAGEYKEQYDKYKASLLSGNAEDEEDKPEYDAKSDALMSLLSGETEAHFHAHRADDICTAIRIAKEFGLCTRLVHCTEGHLIADYLGEFCRETGAGVFLGPYLSDRSKPELSNMTFDNPGILSAAGVPVAITTDHPVTPLKYLPMCASLSVKCGMDREEAYRALTVTPARLLGIDGRVGAIKPGLDGDMVLFDGDPLEMFTRVKRVFVNGTERFVR